MKTYDDLKSELPMMLEIVGKAPEPVQGKVLDMLVSSFLGQPATPAAFTEPQTTLDGSQGKSGPARGRKRKSAGESYQIDKTLSLRSAGEHGSFRDFYSSKAPASAAEFTAVAVYYLVHAASIGQPTFNQLYTCYKDVGRRTPEFFKQSVIDTKNKQGWVDLTEDGLLVLTHRGTEFVEHDLPKAKATKLQRKE